MKEDCNTKKRYTPEEIVAKLRPVDVLNSQGAIKGNDYRSIALQYRAQVPAIRFFGTHSEYDEIDAETV